MRQPAAIYLLTHFPCYDIDLLCLVTQVHTGLPNDLTPFVSCMDINLLFAVWSASQCQQAGPRSRCHSDREHEEWLQKSISVSLWLTGQYL